MSLLSYLQAAASKCDQTTTRKRSAATRRTNRYAPFSQHPHAGALELLHAFVMNLTQHDIVLCNHMHLMPGYLCRRLPSPSASEETEDESDM